MNKLHTSATFLVVLVVHGLFSSSVASAAMISFEMTGNFVLSVNSVYNSTPREVSLVFSIDDGTADSLVGDGSAGGFAGGVTKVTIADLGFSDVIATNITAIFQKANQMHVAEAGNLYTQAIGIASFSPGPINDVNQLAPLNSSPISGPMYGSGVLWQLANGNNFQINQVIGPVQIGNVSVMESGSAVPEPASATLLGLALLTYCSFVLIRRRMTVGAA